MNRNIVILSLLLFCFLSIKAQSYYLFTGTYTTGSSEGIYVFRFNALTGEIVPVDTAKGVVQPSYLTVSADGKFVYAVNETGEKEPGQISAFAFDKKAGKLKLLNKKPSRGDYPCYITVSNHRKWVIAGNYGGGNLVAYKLNEDGSLSDNYQRIQDTGSSVNPERQEKPHVHTTVFSPDQNYLLVTDLGTDKIYIYKFSEGAEEIPLEAGKTPFVKTHPGSGPRHLSFHPNGKFVYLVEELSGEVSGWKYKNGTLTPIQNIDTHAPGYQGSRGSADIHVSTDGKNLYVSNRFEANNLTIFEINQKNGTLKKTGYQSVLGSKPRNFAIDPTGKYVLVANQESNDIRVFQRNPKTGSLSPTQTIVNVGNPVCLKFYPAK